MKLKPLVFFPPFGCFALALFQALGQGDAFFKKLQEIQNAALTQLGTLFSWGTFALLVSCGVVFISPLGRVKIGGNEAKPILSKWRWFAVTLCTTVAVGLVFWGTAEPLFHWQEPSQWLQAGDPQSKIRFALSSLYFHWSLTPYAIYAVPALVFALTYYNHKKPFSLSAPLSPLFGDRLQGKWGQLIDAVCLFSLVAGMSASLGTGVLTISGGLRELTGIPNSTLLLAFILLAIVVAFVASAITGVTRGIRLLSEINALTFFILVAVVFLFGPTRFIVVSGLESLGTYFVELIPRSLYTGSSGQLDPWAKNWTFFYWCNWLAWAPVTALFLGRISVGYTVREMLVTNLLLPSVFAWVWMAVFGGWALNSDMQSSGSILQMIQTQGPESALYALFRTLSIPQVMKTLSIFLVVVTAFLAYVTSAEANTSAMAAMSTQGISPENPEAPLGVKVLWGVCVGLTSGVMIAHQGMDGIKTLSVLGGVPSLFLILLILGSLLKLIGQEFFKKTKST